MPGARARRLEIDMNLSTLERRIRALERKSAPPQADQGIKLCSRPAHHRRYSHTAGRTGRSQLREIGLIREEALVAGDHRLALACVREFCRVAELRARLRGEIDEKTITNVLHVHFDADTAKRVAETYLARTRKLESHE